MSLLDRVLTEPELRAAPPVLVDVGAAGGVHPAWRRIARHAIGVGFEPDAREAAALSAAQQVFKKWIFCPVIAVPAAAPAGRATLHLTRSPQCSSTLHPLTPALAEWAFADFFEVVEARDCPAQPLADALRAAGLDRVDWLKCDTQGTDLRLYLSLPAAWRARLLAVEFEPGLIDTYEGEDRGVEVLAAMAREPFWLAGLSVGCTPRGRPALLTRHLGPAGAKWFRRLTPGAPGWLNLRYLRDPAVAPEALDRRGLLLAWVFASLSGQHGQALTVATTGRERCGGDLFHAMTVASVRNARWAMWRGLPGAIARRFARL